MTTPTVDTRHGAGGRGVWWFVVAGALVFGLILGPAALAGPLSGTHLSIGVLPATVAAGFARWMQSGQASSESMTAAVSFWAMFHVVKAVIALALLVVLVPVVRRLWRAGDRFPAWGQWTTQRTVLGVALRVTRGVAGLVSALAMPLLVLIVMANVQGAVAPLSSVLTFLPLQGSAVADVQAQLADGQGTEQMTAPVTALVHDFRLYHLALLIVAVVAMLVAAAAVIAFWCRRARTPRTQRRSRRVMAAGGTVSAAMVLFLGVVMLANASTVVATAPALAAFFDGSGV